MNTKTGNLSGAYITGRESTRDMPLSQSATMNEDTHLVDNARKASLRRFNLRLKSGMKTIWKTGRKDILMKNCIYP